MEVFNINNQTDVRKIIEKVKSGSRTVIIMTLIINVFFTGIVAWANKGISNLPVMGSFIFWSIPPLIGIISHLRIEKKFEKLKSELGAESDEEMNRLLENFSMLKRAIFINKECFINLNTQRICRFSEIKEISTYHTHRVNRGRYYHSYNIQIVMNNGKRNDIGFGNDENMCEKIYNFITSTAAFAEGSGYRSIISDADDD